MNPELLRIIIAAMARGRPAMNRDLEDDRFEPERSIMEIFKDTRGLIPWERFRQSENIEDRRTRRGHIQRGPIANEAEERMVNDPGHLQSRFDALSEIMNERRGERNEEFRRRRLEWGLPPEYTEEEEEQNERDIKDPNYDTWPYEAEQMSKSKLYERMMEQLEVMSDQKPDDPDEIPGY